MPYKPQIFQLRNKTGAPLAYAVAAEAVTLFGVEGFAYHRKADGVRDEWRISHIATGSLVGRGASKEQAFENALARAGSKDNLLDGMRRMREVVQVGQP